MEEFGARLAKIREEAGLTQTGLAERVGTSQSAISQMENGDRKPSFDMLRQLATALGVRAADLLASEPEDERSGDEQAHFRQYRSLPEEAREELRAFADFLRQRHSKGRT